MRRVSILLALYLICPSAWAMRSKRPQQFTDLKDTNQLSELNSVLTDQWNIANGRYTLENLTTNPQNTRKGIKGDLVYATFGSNDHLCINTSFPEGKNWTCVNVGTLSTCPGGADGMIQFNDNGTCGGDADFLWSKNTNLMGMATVTGSVVGYNSGGTKDDSGIIFGNGTATQTPSGSQGKYYVFRATDQAVAAGFGDNLNLIAGNGNTTGQGGFIVAYAGAGGTTGDGGNVQLNGGAGGSISGNGRGVDLTAGNATTSGAGGDIYFNTGNGVGTSKYGGSIYAQLGNGTGNGGSGQFVIRQANDITGVTANFSPYVNLYSQNYSSLGLASGVTIPSIFFNTFEAPTINGVAGGATETVTNAATVYIDTAPSGSNITFTNGPYALWVDSGTSRFDGLVEAQANATVTGTLVVSGNTTVNGTLIASASATVTGTLVVSGQATVTGSVVTWDTITSKRTTDLGWSVVAGANTACNTTCTHACVFGFDTALAGTDLVDCTDTTADRCLCAGPN